MIFNPYSYRSLLSSFQHRRAWQSSLILNNISTCFGWKIAWKCCRSPAGALAASGFVGPSRQRAGEPPLLLAGTRGDSSSHWAEGSRRPWNKQGSCLQELGTTERRSPAAMETLPVPKPHTHRRRRDSNLPFLNHWPRPAGLKPSCFGQEFPFRRENLDVDSKMRTIQPLVPQVVSWKAPVDFAASLLCMLKLCHWDLQYFTISSIKGY